MKALSTIVQLAVCVSKSINKAETWDKIQSAGDDTITIATVYPSASKTLIVFSVDQGHMMSRDDGKSWSKLNSQANEVPVIHFSYDGKQPNIMYTLLQDLTIHKSDDGGATWTKIH